MELIRNNKQTLDMIADYYYEGMEGTKGKAANGDGGARYSIQTTENGKQYVEADRNVISGDNPSEWARQVEDYINNEIRHGRDVTVYSANGVPLTITADTAGKATFRNFVDMPNGKRRLMTDEEYARKLNAESHIDEIAQVSRGTGSTIPDRKNHPFAKDGFNYRTAYFKDNSGYYELRLSIGKNGNVNTIYNIGKIQSPPTGNFNPRSPRGGATAEKCICMQHFSEFAEYYPLRHGDARCIAPQDCIIQAFFGAKKRCFYVRLCFALKNKGVRG